MNNYRQQKAWEWAMSKISDEQCICHRDLPIEEIQTKEFIDWWKQTSDTSHPPMFVAWNPRCPIHGFLPESPEYKAGITVSESWDTWLPRWEELMAMKVTHA